MKECILFIFIGLFFCPSQAQNLKIDQKLKDTVFYKIDENYFQQGKYNYNQYFIKDALKDKGSSEVFFFQVTDTLNNLIPVEIQDLKNFVRNSKFYHAERSSNKLDDFDLASHFENYVVYLVNSRCEELKFFRVLSRTEID